MGLAIKRKRSKELFLPFQRKKSTQKIVSKPYFRSNGITFYQQDCVEGVREHLTSESVDVVVTLPPYNIGTQFNTYRDKKPREKYRSWIEEVANEIRRVLAHNGSFFLNVGGLHLIHG